MSGKATWLVLIVLIAPSLCSAQQPETRWFGPGKVFGPVRSIRVEKADIVKRNGELVEGPRVLLQTATYNTDGTRVELSSYQPDGSVAVRTVERYDTDGRRLEKTTVDSRGEVANRMTWSYDDGKRLIGFTIYRPDGSVAGKTTYTYDGNLRFQHTENYDRNGLIISKVNATLDMNTHRTESIAQTPEGNAQRTSSFTDTANGQTYEATLNGAPADKIVSTRVGTGAQVTQYSPDEAITSRGHNQNEFDSHGNSIKTIWFAEQVGTDVSRPVSIYYRTFEYYPTR
jgi:antitoxin component YwqK of YwqJK toxin-antitoxin module